MSARDERPSLEAQVTRMEVEIAQLVARGEAVPPEAERMLARLREVAVALAGLTASFERERGPTGSGG